MVPCVTDLHDHTGFRSLSWRSTPGDLRYANVENRGLVTFGCRQCPATPASALPKHFYSTHDAADEPTASLRLVRERRSANCRTRLSPFS